MSSGNELVVLNNQAAIQQGGLGINFGSKLFQLKPATLNINQPTTQAEGAIRGHLRIAETGDQFKEMEVALLLMPVEKRDYNVGEPGEMKRGSDNLMCFCRNVVRDQNTNKELSGPDDEAKVPQALKCDGCAKADWSKWRQNKVKENIPPCETYYYALLVDTVYKMPLRMYVRSKSRAPFEAGMQNLARTFVKLQSQGGNPSIFDIKFKLSTKPITTNGKVTYVLDLSNFQPISPEDRESFGNLYLQYTSRDSQNAAATETAAADPIEEATQTIDSQVVQDGEYVDAETITI